MPRLAAHLTMLFDEVPFLDRFERAAAAGFGAVEFLFPHDFDAAEIRARLDAHGLQLVLHNLPAADWDAGERGIACHPDRVDEFRAGVAEAIEYATALGVPRLNCLAGKAPAGVDAAVLRRTFVQFDTYHAQRIEGELSATLAARRARIGHIQLADNPGRHEPGTGEINYAFLFAHLDRIGHQGWVGCEYRPAATTEAGQGWRERLAG